MYDSCLSLPDERQRRGERGEATQSAGDGNVCVSTSHRVWRGRVACGSIKGCRCISLKDKKDLKKEIKKDVQKISRTGAKKRDPKKMSKRRCKMRYKMYINNTCRKDGKYIYGEAD
jgi:hypothetical protein